MRRETKRLLFFRRIVVKLTDMPLAKLKTNARTDYTVNEYLQMERSALERHEYIDGEIYQMAGESDEHGDISVNLTLAFGNQLRGKDCRVRTKDAKVKSGGFAQVAGKSTKGMYSYPDLVVVCGEVIYYDKKKDVILNPKVIMEVLSDWTELFDRNDKFTRYRMFNETLTDYVLVSQEKPQIEHFIRQDDRSWRQYTYIGLDNICRIESIECSLDLKEIFDRIKLSKKTLDFLKEIENI